MGAPAAIITGASSGIGAAFAHVFAENGHRTVLVARRAAPMQALADEIAGAGRPRPVVVALDLLRPDAAALLAAALAEHDLEAEYVVNNAGFGLVGRAAELDRVDQLAMVDLNIRALTDLSLAFIAPLARNKGGILNVASVASFVPGPGSAVYYASKAYVLSLSDALRVELAPRGIRVTTVCPGPVPTEFQARAGVPGDMKGGFMTRSAEQVARAGYRALMANRRVVVVGWPNWLITALARLLPGGLVLALMARAQARRYAIKVSS